LAYPVETIIFQTAATSNRVTMTEPKPSFLSGHCAVDEPKSTTNFQSNRGRDDISQLQGIADRQYLSWLGPLTERLLVSGGARELLLSLFLHRDWRYWNRHPLPGPSEESERTISLRPGSGY